MQPGMNDHHAAKGDQKGSVVLVYGYYVNWGRVNHNTNRINYFVHALVNSGFEVQMEYHEHDADYVIAKTKDGKEIFKIAGALHNKNWGNYEDLAEDMVDHVRKHFA